MPLRPVRRPHGPFLLLPTFRRSWWQKQKVVRAQDHQLLATCCTKMPILHMSGTEMPLSLQQNRLLMSFHCTLRWGIELETNPWLRLPWNWGQQLLFCIRQGCLGYSAGGFGSVSFSRTFANCTNRFLLRFAKAQCREAYPKEKK